MFAQVGDKVQAGWILEDCGQSFGGEEVYLWSTGVPDTIELTLPRYMASHEGVVLAEVLLWGRAGVSIRESPLAGVGAYGRGRGLGEAWAAFQVNKQALAYVALATGAPNAP